MPRKEAWYILIATVLLFACTEKKIIYPWIEDASVKVDAQGKLVGYEFWAKW